MARIKDLNGRQFGLLKVIKFDAVHPKTKNAMWLCLCECGRQVSVVSKSLSYGSSKSCGCKRLENTKSMAKTYLTKHGKTVRGNSKIYRIWANMVNRCTNAKASNYKYYGQRGIKVSEEWRNFENFYKDMGDCPSEKTLDRIDVNGNYEKENCRWVTWDVQCKNKRPKQKNNT
jgi:hypothetical protein